MLLAKDEVVLKSWTYAKSKQGGERATHTLDVTNKRVIVSEESNRGIERSEVPLAAVKCIHGSTKKPSIVGAVLCFILGALLIIMSIAGAGEGTAKMVIPGVVAGVVLFIIGAGLLNQGAFVLELVTSVKHGVSLEIGAVKISKRLRKGKLKVKVYNDVAKEIMDEIGAIILNCQANKEE